MAHKPVTPIITALLGSLEPLDALINAKPIVTFDLGLNKTSRRTWFVTVYLRRNPDTDYKGEGSSLRTALLRACEAADKGEAELDQETADAGKP